MTKFILGVSLFILGFLLMKVFAGEPGSASDPMVTKSFLEESYSWKVITLRPGEKFAMELGTEIILRSGKGIVIGTKRGGLSDLTLGSDLPDQTLIPANHYLLSPAADGRGVKALSTAVLLTRGLVR